MFDKPWWNVGLYSEVGILLQNVYIIKTNWENELVKYSWNNSGVFKPSLYHV